MTSNVDFGLDLLEMHLVTFDLDFGLDLSKMMDAQVLSASDRVLVSSYCICFML